ncbi:hypothetical protein O3M35_003052 [Rhynocoris fuscipes]|uniref:Uncharacterized protein n=1 Tax=Rhynocoris fuscipes TaxID=488301 RepID=A0AAW1CJ19_9HEMI
MINILDRRAIQEQIKQQSNSISWMSSMKNLITTGGLLSVLLISIVALSNQQETHEDQDVTAIKNQLTSMSTNIEHVIGKVSSEENTKFPIFAIQENIGQFKKPTDRKDLLNKLNELKNNITKMIDDMTTHAGDITSMKDRINMLEKELENLTIQLSNAGRDVQQELKDFSNELSKLTASLNDYYRKQEQKEKQRLEDEKKKEIDEFIKTFKFKYYDYAAFKLSMINDKVKIKKFILEAYKSVELNIDILLEFIKFIKEPHTRYLAYKTLYEYIKTYEKQPYELSCEKHMKLSAQLHKDKDENYWSGYMPELYDETDPFNKLYHSLDLDEFLGAFKNKNYKYAQFQLSLIKDDNIIDGLIVTAYTEFEPMMDFINSIEPDKKHLKFIVYKSLYKHLKDHEYEVAQLEGSIFIDFFTNNFNENMPELQNKSDPYNSIFYTAANRVKQLIPTAEEFANSLNDMYHIPFFSFTKEMFKNKLPYS